MNGRVFSSRAWVRLLFSALALLAYCGQAYAQTAPAVPGRQVFNSKAEPLVDTFERMQRDPRPATADGALQALDWLIYGNVSAGSAYDSNVFDSPNKKGVYGARFQPSIVAARNTGIQRTLAYGTGDIRYYPSQSRTEVLNTTAGLAHVWEIQRDLLFRAQLEATRSQENSALTVALGGTGATYNEPIKFTSLFASTSMEKSFGQFFTAIGGSVTGNIYQDTKNSLGIVIDEKFRNGSRSTVNGRIGYHVTPIVYTFVEPSMNWGRFRDPNLDSNGYQLVGGLGTARISLFNGEIYGGGLKQHFADPLTPDLTRFIFGGRISWFPTRFMTFTGSYDQTLGTSDFSASVFRSGSAVRLNTLGGAARWEVLRNVTMEGTAQFKHFEYLSSNRQDDERRFGTKTTYMFTDRLGITMEYMYVVLTSNLAGVGFTKNFVSLGATSRF